MAKTNLIIGALLGSVCTMLAASTLDMMTLKEDNGRNAYQRQNSRVWSVAFTDCQRPIEDSSSIWSNHSRDANYHFSHLPKPTALAF